MAYPTMGAPDVQLSLTGTTSHPINMPASVGANRMLVAIIGSPYAVTTPNGWTVKKSLTTTGVYLYAFAKIADGSEGGTTVDFVTASGCFIASHLYYASDANYTLANCFAVSTGTTGTSTSPDPDSLTSGFGATDTTWIAAMAAAATDVTGFPASYGNTTETYYYYGILGSADRDVNGSSENPGAFTIASAAWAALTIGIQINPASQPTISSVAPSEISDTLTGVVITGTNYNASKGAGKVELSDSSTYGAGTLVTQTTTAWGATSITFTVGAGSFGAGTLYVYVTNNEGGVSAASTVTLVDAPIALGTIKGIGAQPMGVEVYERDDLAASLGFLRIIDADTDEAIDEIGSYRFSVPAATENTTLLTEGRVIAIHRETEGAIFWGIIADIDVVIADDARLMTVTGPSLDDELNYLNTKRAMIFDDVAPATAFAAILSPASWTTDLTGSGYENVTKRYDNSSLYAAALDFAHLQQGYLRRTSTSRHLEIKNSSQHTGIRLRNVENVGPELLRNPAMGIIRSMTYKRQGRDIWNKIIPEGKTDGDRLYGLGSSGRSSPYAIQSEFVVAPSVSSYTFLDTGSGSSVQLVGGIEVRGVNRLLLAFVRVHSSDPILKLVAGGREMILLDGETTATPAGYYVYYLVNPPIGFLSVEATSASQNSVMSGVLVAVQDADQTNPIRSAGTSQGTSTGPSQSVTSAVGDLLIGNAQWINASANFSSRGAGQTAILQGTAPNATTAEYDTSTKAGAAGSQAMSTTISSSTLWVAAAVSIRPALVYYISDATSDAAYGTREKPLAVGDFKPINGLTLTNAANAMYDKAVDYLLKHRSPLRVFEAPIASLNQSPVDWNVGDSLHVEYQDAVAGIDLDEWMVVTRRKGSYRDGIREWSLTLADSFRNPEDDASVVVGMQKSIVAIQANQV